MVVEETDSVDSEMEVDSNLAFSYAVNDFGEDGLAGSDHGVEGIILLELRITSYLLLGRLAKV